MRLAGSVATIATETGQHEFREQNLRRAELQIALEDSADRVRFFRHDFELLVDAAIAERNGPTDPEALMLGGRDLVAHPLAD